MALPKHGQVENTRFNVGSFMCVAAGSGDRDRLEWVISLPNGRKQLEYRNRSGQTPLLIACSKGHECCARLLLENGANLNATAVVDGNELTCLKLAQRSEDAETISFIKKCLDEMNQYGDCLVKLEAELITICSKAKSSPEELARLDKLAEVFQIRNGRNDGLFGDPLIIRACKAGNLELVEHLVNNIHVTHFSNDSEGCSILHIAVKNKSKMRFVLTKRFPELLCTVDTCGQAPVYLACCNNDMEYIKWLFELILLENKSRNMTPRTPPPTPMKEADTMSPPLIIPRYNIVDEEEEAVEESDSGSDSLPSLRVNELDEPEMTSLAPNHQERKIPTSLSSSDVKLMMDNLQESIPSGPLLPITYLPYVNNMKVYSVNIDGENIFHVTVKNNYHQLLDYILKTSPQFGSSPAQRDFWIRAERMDSPIDEAITRGHAECLDILITFIVHYCGHTKLYSDDFLLNKAVFSGHVGVVKTLISHGIYKGVVKALCLASNHEALPLLLFYWKAIEVIEGGEQLVMQNRLTLCWQDLLLAKVEPVWFKLASDAIDMSKKILYDHAERPAEAVIREIAPSVVDHFVQHINDPIDSLSVSCFTVVQLNENDLETVPTQLFTMPCLKDLDLSSNRLRELPPSPCGAMMCYPCNSLKTLKVSQNSLVTLPSWLFLLPQLESVDASKNKIKELPTATWISPSLLSLNLCNNKLKRLHDLTGVQFADCQEYQNANQHKLELLLNQLKYLDSLDNDGKRKLSSCSGVDDDNTDSTINYNEENESSVLCHLKHLDLSYNRFDGIPQDLACLAPRLEKLLLIGNCIIEIDITKDLPSALSAISMQSCGLRNASVTRSSLLQCTDVIHLLTGADVNGYCEHCNHDYLGNLASLNLKCNRLTSLKVAFQVEGDGDSNHPLFPALSVLDVSNNQLANVPDHLELMTELSSLNLSDNPITTMPCSISQLSQLWVINLDNLMLCNVPAAVTNSHSATQLKNYLKHLHQKSQPYRRIKLMFVGESNKGKTSLLMGLTKKGRLNRYQDVKLNVNRKPLSTVGVDLGDWEYAKQTRLLHAGRKVIFMTWDFGGQEEYYATHQCFLSPHALYVLVWNVLDGNSGLENLRPWLQNIESRAMGAQVIVAGTHVDLWDATSHRATLEEALTKKFRELYIDCDSTQRRTYPRIVEKMYFIDTYNKDHLGRLRDAIYDYALEYRALMPGKKKPPPLLEELVPACYVSLEESVRAIAADLRDKRQIPILSHQEYIDHVNTIYDCSNFSPAELKQATQFLHDKGILLHYDEGQLSDLYFVDPQWLCSMLAKVIAVSEVQPYQKSGFISHKELSRTLGPREHVEECISLMQKFEVLFELDSSRYLIPSLLPVDESQSCVVFPSSIQFSGPEPASSVQPIPMGSHSNCLVRFLMLPFVPNGMFPRLSARLIATGVIDQVFSSLKVDSLADDQQLLNRLHWRVWRTGITMVWRHIQIFRIAPVSLPAPGIDVVHVIQPKELVQSSSHCNVYEGDSLMVQVDILPDEAFTNSTSGLQMATWLLQQAVEQINSVFDDWYEEFAWKRSIDLNVVAADPCPHCMRIVYEHWSPDLYAAKKRLEPKEAKEKKPSLLRSFTMPKKFSAKMGRPGTTSIVDLSCGTMRKLASASSPTWSAGRLYGQEESVLYLFSVKLSALSVMEATVLTCPSHGAISINQIAPDMIFADLCLNMRVNPEDVAQKQYLDEGGFGCIYAATVKLQGGKIQEVAIKSFTTANSASANGSKSEVAWHHYQSANSEGRIMASFQHANILKLVGIALQPIRLLLEFAPLGSLKNVVNRYRDGNARMNRYVLQKLIDQVSSAMEYLHCNSIIYRDVKLANVLVWEFPEPHLNWLDDSSVLVKLADYGISKQVVPWGIRGMQGTPPYLAPEVILHGGKQAYTSKIDVYSFGMMLLYLFTYVKPFGKITRPLRAYLESEQRPEMSPKHRPSCQWMYELMCWSWSSKPHHRPSFTAMRQLVFAPAFTRLHHVVRVDLSKHLVIAMAAKRYKPSLTPSRNKQRHKSLHFAPGHPTPENLPLSNQTNFSLQLSTAGNATQPGEVEATKVYYGTDFGMVGVVDMQQSSTTSQSIGDMGSVVTCMSIVHDHLWVGSHAGVKVFDTKPQLLALWNTTTVVSDMMLLPTGHFGDGEALLMLTKSKTIVLFTVLQWTSVQLLEEITPDHVIPVDCELLTATLVPPDDQLWVCAENDQLLMFSAGCYDNHNKHIIQDMGVPCCMATANGFVLVAVATKVKKLQAKKSPVLVSSVDCEPTIMDKIREYDVDGCQITSLLGHEDVVYAGTRGGAIVVVGVAKMIVFSVLCTQTSPINALSLIKQSSEVKITTLKRSSTSLIINHSLHHDPQDDCLLVNFALGYHGIAQNSDTRPPSYNLPIMTSQCGYHPPVPYCDPNDLYMLLWSAHPW